MKTIFLSLIIFNLESIFLMNKLQVNPYSNAAYYYYGFISIIYITLTINYFFKKKTTDKFE